MFVLARKITNQPTNSSLEYLPWLKLISIVDYRSYLNSNVEWSRHEVDHDSLVNDWLLSVVFFSNADLDRLRLSKQLTFVWFVRRISLTFGTNTKQTVAVVHVTMKNDRTKYEN